MGWTSFNRYKDKWVLCSKAKVLGGAEIDVEPVRLVDAARVDELTRMIEELLVEDLPDVPPPDLNDPKNLLGIRAKAAGAASWRAFNGASRTFLLREEGSGLVLEEWPKDGGRPVWRRTFPVGAVEEAVGHVVRLTTSSEPKRKAKKS